MWSEFTISRSREQGDHAHARGRQLRNQCANVRFGSKADIGWHAPADYIIDERSIATPTASAPRLNSRDTP